jgi:hypothetical protein
MATVIAEEELYRSCRLIFGKDLKVSPDFLQYLQLSGIKKAYRKKALEFHPDRGFCQTLTLQQSMANKFIDVHQAYEKLLSYLEAREKGLELDISSGSFSTQKDKEEVKIKRSYQNSTSSRDRIYRKKANGFQYKNNNGGQQKTSFHGPPLDPKSLYRGPLPNCQLLFGRYLYYSGLINLHTIGQALVWQRSQRPCFGEIGRRMGLMDEQDTFKILRQKKNRQLFGELALRLGILTQGQQQSILLHQKKLHKRIGQYFVIKNYWDTVMLEAHIAAHRNHNSRVQNLFS